MRPPSNSHANFFSSLKQVEKRLKLDNPCGESSSLPPKESLSSPIYLNFEQPNTTTSSAYQDSEPPKQFLTCSFDFPQTNENQQAKSTPQEQTTERLEVGSVDEIDLLVGLLGLSDCDKDKKRDEGFKNDGDDSGFYGKVVGMKGPKCRKERERMDGWIKHFMGESDGGERNREPLRLAHLLLGKFSSLSQRSDSLEELGFPSTIEEFLQADPPEVVYSCGKKEVVDRS